MIHAKLADGVLCGNLPNFAGQVPSKNEIGFVLGITAAAVYNHTSDDEEQLFTVDEV